MVLPQESKILVRQTVIVRHGDRLGDLQHRTLAPTVIATFDLSCAAAVFTTHIAVVTIATHILAVAATRTTTPVFTLRLAFARRAYRRL
jgi:hypothetical protein